MVNNRTDAELLADFRLRGDDEAFAELVHRHGRTVRNAALSVIGEVSTAEDIAQGAFVALVRRSPATSEVCSIGGWLYRVAVCIARDERRKRLRRETHEKAAALTDSQGRQDARSGGSDTDISAMHEELAGLPDLYRLPVVLHYIEGRSYDDSANAIGCKVNTFGNRLARAREMLKKRLIKRGITGVTMGALVAMLGQSAEAAEVSSAFVAATCAAAKGGAVSAKVAALTESALKMLFWAKVKAVTAVCAGVAVVAAAGIGAAVGLPLFSRSDAALTPDGQVWVWGKGDPTLVRLADGAPLSNIRAISAGNSTAVLKADGTVWSFGSPGYSQDRTLADGVKAVQATMADGTPLSDVTAVATAGEGHFAALRSDRTVWTWGRNDYGKLGDGTANTSRMHAMRVPGLADVTAIAAGQDNTFALRADSTVWGWGCSTYDQLGKNTEVMGCPRPLQIMQNEGTPLSGVSSVAVGASHVIVVKTDGHVWTWGANESGQLGNGTRTPSPDPIEVRQTDGRPLDGVVAIDVGNNLSVALKSDGSIWAWGGLVKGDMVGVLQPVRLQVADGEAIDNVTAVAAGPLIGEFKVVAVTRDGTCLGLAAERVAELDDGNRVLLVRATRAEGVRNVISVTTSPWSIVMLAGE